MEIKAVFGILSAVFTLGGVVPYFININKRKIHPHNLSWLGWFFITLIGGLAMLDDNGGQWSSIIIFTNSLSCLIIIFYSIYKKVGVWSTTAYDYLFFIAGILGIILWQIFDAPLIAIIFAVFADLSFGIPTIIKTYKNPKSEICLSWLSSSIAGLLSLFAVKSFMLSGFLYPLYLFLFDVTILFIILTIKNEKRN